MTSTLAISAKLPFQLEKEGKWIVSSCLLLNVHSQGKTEEEAQKPDRSGKPFYFNLF